MRILKYVCLFIVAFAVIGWFALAFTLSQIIKMEAPILHPQYVYTTSSIDLDITKKLITNNYIPTNIQCTNCAIITDSDTSDDCLLIEKNVYVGIVNVKSKINDINQDYSLIVDGAPTGGKIMDVSKIYDNVLKDANIVGVIPVDKLTPNVRAIKYNDKYPWDNGYGLVSSKYLCDANIEDISVKTNFDTNYVLTLTQTGVTAITRAMTAKINSVGIDDWPALKIADFLNQSDLVHTSNEVSFADGCGVSEGLTFCSQQDHFKTLLTAGINIVELTGNHNNDYGAKWNEKTIEWYEENNIQYFGGGENLEAARKVLIIDKKGTMLALIGYNFYNAYYNYTGALAGENKAGANPYSDEQMEKDIKWARENADIVIVDFQFQECWCYNEGDNSNCYYPIPYPSQREYFGKAIDLGADIVVGTQAHMPQIIEIYKDKPIFYGLGNMFFDQLRWDYTRQGMIITHVFYKGKHLTTIVTPTYINSDMQPEVVTGDYAERLLDIYYQR